MIHRMVKRFRKNIVHRVPYRCKVSAEEYDKSNYSWGKEYYRVIPPHGYRIWKENTKSFNLGYFAARFVIRVKLRMVKT